MECMDLTEKEKRMMAKIRSFPKQHGIEWPLFYDTYNLVLWAGGIGATLVLLLLKRLFNWNPDVLVFVLIASNVATFSTFLWISFRSRKLQKIVFKLSYNMEWQEKKKQL